VRFSIITSCTGEKVVVSDWQLTREDFALGQKHVAKREKEMMDLLRTAGEIYSGEQHIRLMRGVSALRSTLDSGRSTVSLHILSAGYGIVPEDRVIAPYEITFATMKSKELGEWADFLHVPQDFRKTVATPYDFGMILLGDNYLSACALDEKVTFGGPTLLFCGTGMAKKLPKLKNVRVVPISNPEARRFSCGLVGLKGDLAARVLAGISADASVVGNILDTRFNVLKWLDGAKLGNSHGKIGRRFPTVGKIAKQSVCHVIAGPNGAGKSTFALHYLPDIAKCENFVNADLIAAGLSPINPASVAIKAGRMVLERIAELSSKGLDFGFETTLAGKHHARTIEDLKGKGYLIVMRYLWIPSTAFAILRIRNRVALGGHHVPAQDVRRRFRRSIQNLFGIFEPLVDELILLNNSISPPEIIFSQRQESQVIHNVKLYRKILKQGQTK
jgi:predicted ABC-type ATPase